VGVATVVRVRSATPGLNPLRMKVEGHPGGVPPRPNISADNFLPCSPADVHALGDRAQIPLGQRCWRWPPTTSR